MQGRSMADHEARPKIRFLTGAPLSNSLDWSEACLLPLHNFTDSVDRFLKEPRRDEVPIPPPTASNTWPSWRSIPVPSSPCTDHDLQSSQFIPTQTAEEEEHDITLNFLEHSILAYDTQTAYPEEDENVTSTTTVPSFETTFLTSEEEEDDSFIIPPAPTPQRIPLPPSASTTALSQLHSPSDLRRLSPATVTVNLIVTLIAVLPTRTISLKRFPNGRCLDIIELLVADETRTGFKINLWFSHSTIEGDSVRRSAIEKVPRGQIVLLENVALGCYQGVVYGQSLRPVRGKKSVTTVTCLSVLDVMLYPAWAREKVERVEKWARNFLGTTPATRVQGVGGEKEGGDAGPGSQVLPPDTQAG